MDTVVAAVAAVMEVLAATAVAMVLVVMERWAAIIPARFAVCSMAVLEWAVLKVNLTTLSSQR